MTTKPLARDKSDEFIKDLDGEYRAGRAGKAVRLFGTIDAIRIAREINGLTRTTT